MALKQLNDEEVATWTRLQKDTWWFEHVYRGDMPQLTVRAAGPARRRDRALREAAPRPNAQGPVRIDQQCGHAAPARRR